MEELQLEIQKWKSECETLEVKLRELEVQKLNVEKRFEALKRENDELKDRVYGGKNKKQMEKVVDLTTMDDDKVFQLMIENKVLECEKEKAETEVKLWKEKFEELELCLSRLNESSISKASECPLHDGIDLDNMRSKEKGVDLEQIGNMLPAGFSCNQTPYKHGNCIKGEKNGSNTESGVDYAARTRIRKQLIFAEEQSPVKKMAPPTPGGIRPSSLSIIDISDSDYDDEPNNAHNQLPINNQRSDRTVKSSDYALGENIGGEKEMTSENNLKGANHDQNDGKAIDAHLQPNPHASTPKRRRASNIVHSESESDDDNIPICETKRFCRLKIGQDRVGPDLNRTLANATVSGNDNDIATVTPPRRRRLVALKNCRRKDRLEIKSPGRTGETKNHRGIRTCTDSEDENSAEVGSDAEDESLRDFIVSSSDVSEGDYATSESQDVSDGTVDYREVMSKLQRKKSHVSEWEFEADMLAAIGKDPELCMKAVCALYRQQTSDEQICKETLFSNGRGFSKFDAQRGSKLAIFLTDGYAEGNLTKSVEELQEYDHKAIGLCRELALRYSKQLFEIYKNKEDPFFHPDHVV